MQTLQSVDDGAHTNQHQTMGGDMAVTEEHLLANGGADATPTVGIRKLVPKKFDQLDFHRNLEAVFRKYGLQEKMMPFRRDKYSASEHISPERVPSGGGTTDYIPQTELDALWREQPQLSQPTMAALQVSQGLTGTTTAHQQPQLPSITSTTLEALMPSLRPHLQQFLSQTQLQQQGPAAVAAGGVATSVTPTADQFQTLLNFLTAHQHITAQHQQQYFAQQAALAVQPQQQPLVQQQTQGGSAAASTAYQQRPSHDVQAAVVGYQQQPPTNFSQQWNPPTSSSSGGEAQPQPQQQPHQTSPLQERRRPTSLIISVPSQGAHPTTHQQGSPTSTSPTYFHNNNTLFTFDTLDDNLSEFENLLQDFDMMEETLPTTNMLATHPHSHSNGPLQQQQGVPGVGGRGAVGGGSSGSSTNLAAPPTSPQGVHGQHHHTYAPSSSRTPISQSVQQQQTVQRGHCSCSNTGSLCSGSASSGSASRRTRASRSPPRSYSSQDTTTSIRQGGSRHHGHTQNAARTDNHPPTPTLAPSSQYWQQQGNPLTDPPNYLLDIPNEEMERIYEEPLSHPSPAAKQENRRPKPLPPDELINVINRVHKKTHSLNNKPNADTATNQLVADEQTGLIRHHPAPNHAFGSVLATTTNTHHNNAAGGVGRRCVPRSKSRRGSVGSVVVHPKPWGARAPPKQQKERSKSPNATRPSSESGTGSQGGGGVGNNGNKMSVGSSGGGGSSPSSAKHSNTYNISAGRGLITPPRQPLYKEHSPSRDRDEPRSPITGLGGSDNNSNGIQIAPLAPCNFEWGAKGDISKEVKHQSPSPATTTMTSTQRPFATTHPHPTTASHTTPTTSGAPSSTSSQILWDKAQSLIHHPQGNNNHVYKDFLQHLDPNNHTHPHQLSQHHQQPLPATPVDNNHYVFNCNMNDDPHYKGEETKAGVIPSIHPSHLPPPPLPPLPLSPPQQLQQHHNTGITHSTSITTTLNPVQQTDTAEPSQTQPPSSSPSPPPPVTYCNGNMILFETNQITDELQHQTVNGSVPWVVANSGVPTTEMMQQMKSVQLQSVVTDIQQDVQQQYIGSTSSLPLSPRQHMQHTSTGHSTPPPPASRGGSPTKTGWRPVNSMHPTRNHGGSSGDPQQGNNEGSNGGTVPRVSHHQHSSRPNQHTNDQYTIPVGGSTSPSTTASEFAVVDKEPQQRRLSGFIFEGEEDSSHPPQHTPTLHSHHMAIHQQQHWSHVQHTQSTINVGHTSPPVSPQQSDNPLALTPAAHKTIVSSPFEPDDTTQGVSTTQKLQRSPKKMDLAMGGSGLEDTYTALGAVSALNMQQTLDGALSQSLKRREDFSKHLLQKITGLRNQIKPCL